MNSHLAWNVHPLAQQVPAKSRQAKAAPTSPTELSKAVPSTVTLSGIVLFVTCALLYASGFKAYRFEVVGLLVHPYLIPMGLAAPFLLVGRLKDFPHKTLAAMIAFLGMYTLATFGGGFGGMVSECIKVATTVGTIVSIACLVRSRGDFIAGVIGLSAAVGVMGLKGIGSAVDPNLADALDVGNKNAFSLFALPAMLLAGYLILDMPVKRKALRILCKTLLIVTTATCALAIFLSANRSGYLGCVVIGVMLLKEKRLYGLLLVGLVAAVLVYVMMHFDLAAVFHHRWKQTFVEKNESDELRGHILGACFKIGLEYPLAGVSATKLPLKIGEKVGFVHAGMNLIESHNIFAHIWASSGLICFAALISIAWTLWFLPRPPNQQDPLLQHEFTQAHRLLKMMLFLWFFRGMFTSAILYNPGFSMGFGLAIGYCMVLLEKSKGRFAGNAAPAGPMGLTMQP